MVSRGAMAAAVVLRYLPEDTAPNGVSSHRGRPRRPFCDLCLSPQLKRAVDHTLGHCRDTAPAQMHEHLLLSAWTATATQPRGQA
jgi:hypothetical protein